MPGIKRKIPTDDLGPDQISGLKIGDLKLFISAEQTGTGAAQSIAHGLGVTPSKVLVAVTGDARAAWAAFSVVQGTHTATNVVVTVTLNIKFQVLAIA